MQLGAAPGPAARQIGMRERLGCIEEHQMIAPAAAWVFRSVRCQGLARIIHQGWSELREAVLRSVVFGGVEDAGNRGLRLRRWVCSGASGPVVYGGNFAIRPARVAKPAWY